MFNTPKQITEANIKAAKGKATMPIWKLFILGIFAGMSIAGGAAASSFAMHTITNVGLARFVGGCIFPVGLMMIVFIGGELFTGDCLMIMGCVHKQFSVLQVIKVLVLVYISNLVGSLIIAGLVYGSGQFDNSNGLLGAYTIKVALAKSTITFTKGFTSGILCNIFVCAAVLMAAAAKDITGKVFGIFFPIMAFVVSGYEHCVANMYYIPAGIFAKMNSNYTAVAKEAYGIDSAKLADVSWSNYFINNAIPVTLGNIVGGMVFIGLILYVVNRKNLEIEK